jgi:hypothetical protein
VDATTFRRYLQPSPTLRWHPWAPIVAGILLLLFVFYFGERWGWDASQRQYMSLGHVYGGRVYMDYLSDQKWPGQRLVNDAGSIDATVRQFVKRQQHSPTILERARAKLEAFTLNAWSGSQSKDTVVRMAEFRLRELSPVHPRWQATSAWCERYGHRLQDVDVLADYAETARDYSTVLGREVRPQELAPAVSGWKCPAELPRKMP